jgi:transcriptional regulator with XRE-family HTH domain
MDTLRFGRSVRALRRRRGLRQVDIAGALGLSDSTVSRVELGRVGRIPFATIRSIGAAVGAEVELEIRGQGEGLDRLLDEAHSRIVEQIVSMYRAEDWQVAVEASFSIDGERGAIDVFAWHPAPAFVAVNEVK